MSFFGRNNIPMRPGNSYILASSTSNIENEDNINSSQDRKIKDKSRIILNNRTNNKSKRSLKNTNISNYKSNCHKKPDITNNLNKKNNSLYGQNDKLDFLYLKKKYALETEPNKMNNFYQKINQTQNKYNNKDIIINNSKPSNNILSKYYNNKYNQHNKISIKKNKNLNINFNNNSPINGKKSIKMSFNDRRNVNCILNYNNNNCSHNVDNKYQSNSKLNKVINKNYSDYGEISKENEKKEDKNYSERYNLSIKRPLNLLSSNIYINSENNINFRNTSYNNKYSTNYNLINITSPKERKNSYSNLNPQKISRLNYQNNLNIQNIIKKPNKQKYEYSFNQDNIIDKKYLNHFYEETFSNIDNDDNNNMNIFPNYNKLNNDDIIYKDNLTTNQSTYTNTSTKIKNLKKKNHSSNSNNVLEYENIDSFENFEELHFFIISSLQKGNFLANNFD